MKTGLVLEGGAMRGIFTAGVLDVLMENKIAFDGAIGVSAGAAFGCNYKSHQIGRAVRYNKKYCNDRRYASFRSWLWTGNLYNVDFSYNQLPNRLDPFDVETFCASPMEFWVVCTDVQTGNAVYHRCKDGLSEDIAWIRASASMPFFARPVPLDGQFLSDGGTSDSVPVQFFQSLGYERSVVILTQPDGFVKQQSRLFPLLRLALRKYPALVQALKTRPQRYNETLRFIHQQEEAGTLLVIRPSASLKVGAMERNPAELERVYQLGRTAAQEKLCAIRKFLENTESKECEKLA